MTLLGLELAWTRIFSAEFFYTYAFLVLSLAVMGLGLGALTLRLCPALGGRRSLGVVLTLVGCTALAGPPLVFQLGLDFNQLAESWGMVGRLAAAIGLLSTPYFLGGITLAALFRDNHREMPKLYMADLVGAGVGVALAVGLMNALGTPVATFALALPVLIAAAVVGKGWARLVPLVPLAGMLILVDHAETLLEVEREERAPVIYKHWDAMSKIKILEFSDEYHGINIDNAANSPVLAFDGDWDLAEDEKFEFGIDVSNLIGRFEACTFLSLGAGGGGDVLQALQAGAAEIHAVEVNGHINELMLAGELAEFSGNIYSDERVRVITDDARAYVRRHRDKFDVIYSLSSNSWAALASGSFALAENYLFTTEAFEDYWNALTDDGFMAMEHQYYMPRLVGALMDALDNLGVPEPAERFAVYDLPQMRRKLLLVSKQPLTKKIRYTAFGRLTPWNYEQIHLLYPVPESRADNDSNQINHIVQEGWEQVATSATTNIAPCTDDRPFVGQMGLWKNFTWGPPPRSFGLGISGYPLSQVIIAIILAVVVVLVLPLNLLPYVCRGPRLRAAPWLYFFTIGMAFMAVEVVLIQRYTLFVGPSAYSIAAILLTLLVFSGVGSRCSGYVNTTAAFMLLIGWLLVEVFVVPRVTTALCHLEMLPRIMLAATLVAPLGFFMGMPFPKGAARVGPLIDWGLAVNGAASVLGGAAIVLVAMTFGFKVALLTGAGLYACAYLLIRGPARWEPDACEGCDQS